ncbi:CCSMST1 domain containing protein [Asbolus verrucosus]|uniref:CCSMST1 domain containing protein n=1 Tax=Asbolus verrucosus TaxID=1661398 RepID=A0A482VQM3_ASBVE|nr:CCSMST1 domain containing protein [Asbolus verrucosus]
MFSRLAGVSQRVNLRIIPKIHRLVASNSSHATSKAKDIEEELDTPIKYTSSPAKDWQARTTRVGREESRLWYEPYVILFSLTVFMVYFTLIREENDIDEELSKSLYSRINGLEEHQLRVSLEYNRKHNLDTAAIIKRLKELEDEKINK